MKLTFITKVEIEGLHLMTDDQKHAVLDAIIETMTAPSMKDWLKHSEFKSHLQEAAIAALQLEPRKRGALMQGNFDRASSRNTTHDEDLGAEDE